MGAPLVTQQHQRNLEGWYIKSTNGSFTPKLTEGFNCHVGSKPLDSRKDRQCLESLNTTPKFIINHTSLTQSDNSDEPASLHNTAHPLSDNRVSHGMKKGDGRQAYHLEAAFFVFM